MYESQSDTLIILQLVPQKQMSFFDNDGKNNFLDVVPCIASLKNCCYLTVLLAAMMLTANPHFPHGEALLKVTKSPKKIMSV